MEDSVIFKGQYADFSDEKKKYMMADYAAPGEKLRPLPANYVFPAAYVINLHNDLLSKVSGLPNDTLTVKRVIIEEGCLDIYEFEEIPGRWRQSILMDARGPSHCSGVVVKHDDALWLVPLRPWRDSGPCPPEVVNGNDFMPVQISPVLGRQAAQYLENNSADVLINLKVIMSIVPNPDGTFEVQLMMHSMPASKTEIRGAISAVEQFQNTAPLAPK